MEIKQLDIKHFGKFHNKKINFQKGINIVYGDNEAGKSTIYWFIYGMLFGIERQRGRIGRDDLYTKYIPWETSSLYEGRMKIRIREQDYSIYRNFYKTEKICSITEIDTGKEIKADYDFYGGLNNINYKNTVGIGQLKIRTGKELISEITNYAAALSGGCEIDMEKTIKSLKMKKKIIEAKGTEERLKILQKQKENLEALKKEYDSLGNEESVLKQEYRDINKNSIEDTEVKRKYTVTAVMLIIGLITAGFIKVNYAYQLLIILLFGAAGYLTDSKRYQYNRRKLCNNQSYKKEENSVNADEYVRKNIDIQAELEKIRWHRHKLRESIIEIENNEHQYKELLSCKAKEDEEKKAIDLAMECIEKASFKIKDSFNGTLNERISKIIERITNEGYTRVIFDEKLNIKAGADEELHDLEKLSTGTIEQIYLGLRLSAAEFMFEEKNIPLVLDDTFAYFDDTRLERTLELLYYEKSRQIIILTCQEREKSILDKMGSCFNYIKL